MDIATYIVVGFIAQLIDGTLGMAYGLSASSLLLSTGLPPATVSATVHAAECFTTGASGLSHHYFGNIDRALFRKLVIPGVVGATIGAYILASFPSDVFRPIVATYLLVMGCVIIIRMFRRIPPVSVASHVVPLGFVGAFLDAVGGGGWGPVVASTLIARGNQARTTVGSVNAAEFFVTLSASATFIATIGLGYWRAILGLAIGGVIAAPIGAWACRRLPHKPLMGIVGLLVVVLAIRTLAGSF